MHRENFSIYGVAKVWRQVNREGFEIGRDQVARLMRELGLAGAVRGKVKRTTLPAQADEKPADLVERQFKATAPNRPWVADLTFSAWPGFV